MKVVLFCGGLGMRLREYSESTPKPLVAIGHRPILWHIMKYYAYYGHKEFILCLGWRGAAIKEYFLSYNECLSNDFVMRSGGAKIDLVNSDIHDWSISFVDTGATSSIGDRLLAVEEHVAGENEFLANYTDGLSDLHLPDHIAAFRKQNVAATFLSVRPRQSFHAIAATETGIVNRFEAIEASDVWMNGGYFIFKADIFNQIRPGEELVEEPFRRLIAQRRLGTFQYEGFWSCMDTYKEKQDLDDMYATGNTPWEVWKHPARKLG
jgi:glucose-1-phosphate cytidylyltransferase